MLIAATLFVLASVSDTRGPVFSGNKTPIVGPESVQSTVAPQSILPSDKGPGTGQWIWLNQTGIDLPVRFRKTFDLVKAPTSAKAWITAEVRYRLWINGKLAARGPADAGRDYDSGPCGPWFEDVRQFATLFHKGKNVVAVEVFPHPLVSSDASTDRPGLKVDLTFQAPGLESSTFGTDSSWVSAPASDLDQKGADHGFRINLNYEPVGWQLPTYDDSAWGPSRVATEAQRPTLVSELPPGLEAELRPTGFTRVSDGVKPNRLTGGAKFDKNGKYSVHYGHILSGYVGLKIMGHQGTRLLLTPNEHDAPGANRSSEIILREGEQVVELPYFDSFSVVNIEAVGVTQPIEIQDVRCVFTSFPVRYLGQFECSNPTYNQLWEISRWVTQICMQTHHLDSPHHQEPISDAGDYLIESLNSLYAFGEGTLARQDLKKIGRTLRQRKYQSFHTSYSLLWLQMLIQYYQYTGDIEPIQELAPDVFALLDQFETYIGKNGLISEAPNYMFMDWVEIESFNAHHPPAVIGQGYMTALYYRALADAAKVAELTGKPDRVAQFKALQTKIAAAFDHELWVADKGLYRDGKPFQTSIPPNQWLPADRNIETFTTQVNTLAVACGLVPAKRAKAVMMSILARPDLNCQPYFMHFVFEAMAVASLFNIDASSQIQRWKVIPDTKSFHEMWTVGDLSHAWNATPLFQMSGRILGVEPVEPGFKKFRIAPHPCDLKWAKGQVPTPHGFIEASWTTNNGKMELLFVVPKGTTAEVYGKTYSPGSHKVQILLSEADRA